MKKKTNKIAITGGKGGTGKSTVAVLKAREFLKQGKKVILCDCDVECPNDYLILGEKLKEPRKKILGEFPELIKEKCTKCGLCVKTCRENAIFQTPGKYPVFIKNLCSGCGACWTVCPQGAIGTKKEEIGRIYLNKPKRNLWLVTGESNAGLEETGPVVTSTKEFALFLTENNKFDIVLFDTAAGTHCPVISALLGANKALVVTEPTPMGEYDLKLILNLCKKLEVPTEIILNQSDLGDRNRIEKTAKRFKIKIREEIPYSRNLVEAYSKGRLLNFDF